MPTSRVCRLTVPTNRTINGPKLTHNREQLVVDYDCEENDGSVTWSRVVFTEVLSFEFRQSVCCQADDVLRATEIRSQRNSEYLKAITGKWHAAVGSQKWQRDKGGPSRFQHFTIYFDDVCCLNIIASSCEAVPLPTAALRDASPP
jgi:hypothetical protein